MQAEGFGFKSRQVHKKTSLAESDGRTVKDIKLESRELLSAMHFVKVFIFIENSITEPRSG